MIASVLFVVLSVVMALPPLPNQPTDPHTVNIFAEFFDGGHVSPMHDWGCTAYTPGALLKCGAFAEITAGITDCDAMMYASVSGAKGLSISITMKVIPAGATRTMAVATPGYQTVEGTDDHFIDGIVTLDYLDPDQGDVQIEKATAYWIQDIW